MQHHPTVDASCVALHDGPLHLFIDLATMQEILEALERLRPLIVEAALNLQQKKELENVRQR